VGFGDFQEALFAHVGGGDLEADGKIVAALI